ncbi:MAG: purine-binding chemotaxis protein CheW [Planctomycetes bacterium]|nr:purine-binding chemotaxis protein CheW [Planctomycetota bacterium]
MSSIREIDTVITANNLEFVSFYIGDQLMGADIQQAQEINRFLDTTDVPHAPDFVKGVMNLRGEVVTVLDLRKILNLEEIEITEHNRNLIVQADDEQVGIMVDRISDVVIAKATEVEAPPANINGMDSRYFKGVYKLDEELMVILDIDEVVHTIEKGVAEGNAGGKQGD